MDLLTATYFLNGLLMIAVPILLGIYLTGKFGSGWKIWLVGAAVFILSQVAHIPFNLYVLNPLLAQIQLAYSQEYGALAIAGLLGLSAGVFETTARYAMYRWWLRDNRSWRMGVLAGAGHGGIEAILLGILVMLAYFSMLAYRNFDLSSLDLTPEQLSLALQQLQAYWSAPWYTSLLGAVERFFTIPFHIAASVIVLQVFTRKPGHQQLSWFVLAVLLHALMDASAVYFAGQGSIFMAEAVIGGMAVLDVLIILLLRQPEPMPVVVQTPQPVQELRPFVPIPLDESAEKLDNTRYQ